MKDSLGKPINVGDHVQPPIGDPSLQGKHDTMGEVIRLNDDGTVDVTLFNGERTTMRASVVRHVYLNTP